MRETDYQIAVALRVVILEGIYYLDSFFYTDCMLHDSCHNCVNVEWDYI